MQQIKGHVILWSIMIFIIGSSCRPAKVNHYNVERPNFILINADDLSPHTLGPYGQQIIKTPRLDKMAKEGTLFHRAYSAATSCAPSRIALMLGKHLGHIKRKGNTNDDRVASEETCFPEILRDHGYATAMYGKKHGVHLRNWFDIYTQIVDDTPYDNGFDHFVGTLNATTAHQLYLDGETNPEANLPQHLWEEQKGELEKYLLPPTRYVHNEYVDLGLQFIELNQDQPFFLYLPFQLPHFEQVVPKPGEPDYHLEDYGLLEQYQDTITGRSLFPEIPYMGNISSNQRVNLEPNATYAATISRLDRDVGKIMDLIINLNLKEKTYVIFTSDNGYGGWPEGETFDFTGALRAAKAHLYEGGVRVPMIVWGSQTKLQDIHENPIIHYDIGATLLDLAGIQDSFNDGLSWKDAIISDKLPHREYLYWENFLGSTRQCALLDNRYKVIKLAPNSDKYQYEIYDLSKDESESNNILTTDLGQSLLHRASKIFKTEHIPNEHYHIE